MNRIFIPCAVATCLVLLGTDNLRAENRGTSHHDAKYSGSHLPPIEKQTFRYVDLGPAEFVQTNELGVLVLIKVGGNGSITEVRDGDRSFILPPDNDKLTRVGIAISNRGDVVGDVVGRYIIPALWRNHKLTVMGGFTLASHSSAGINGISDDGTMCGYLSLHGNRTKAGTFTRKSFIPLRCPPDAISSFARGMTHNGTIIGWYDDRKKASRAIIWRGGRYQVLPTLSPYTNAEAMAGNTAGLIVGSSGNSNMGAEHSVAAATLWKNGKPYELKSLGGSNSATWSVNSSGWVAGSSKTAAGINHAVVWDEQGIHDLNSLVKLPSSDITLEMALQVNDKGIIVGQSRVDGKRYCFELIPIGDTASELR